MQIEPPLEEGLLRACIFYELEEPEPKLDTTDWRELWPQWQEWRTPAVPGTRGPEPFLPTLPAIEIRQAKSANMTVSILAALFSEIGINGIGKTVNAD